MSKDKPAHPLLSAELVTSTLNSAPLEGLIQQLFSFLSSTQIDLRSLAAKHESAFQATWLELQRLATVQEAMHTRLKESEESKRALVRTI